MDLQTILSILGIVQSVATLILIPIIRTVWEIKVYMEKDKIIKEIILKDIEELKKHIHEIEEDDV
ncbi:MAG: hypothetical protein JHC31_14360 [Sulfurihydrogenibium sp.]|nr:hypothetical protein [Sulfurihydrogenibium sp.]